MRPALVNVGAVFLLLTIYGWFVPEPGPNELSHLDLTYALATEGRTSIDSFGHNTIDRSVYEGRFYSNKAPGLALLATPVLAVLEPALRLGEFGDTRVSYVAHLLTVAVVGLPTALLVVLVATVTRELGATSAAGWAAGLALGLGTALWPFATTLYSHNTAALLAFGGFAAALRAPAASRPALVSAAAGLALGAATLVEFPAGIAALLVLPLLLFPSRDRWRRLAPYVGAGASMALPLGLYNWASFGAPWRLSYALTDFESFTGMREGLFGVSLPTASGVGEILVGPAGLFTQSPFMALGFVGLALLARRRPGPAAVGAAVFVGFVLYNGAFWAPMGGTSTGARYLVPALAFLGFGLAFLPRLAWLLVAPIAVFSALQMLAIAAVEPKPGPGVPDAFLSHWWPRFAAGDVALSWGELRWGLRGAEVALPLIVPLIVGLLGVVAWLVPRSRARAALPATFCLASVATWALLALPMSRAGVPAVFRLATTEVPRGTLGVVYGDTIELVGYTIPDSVRPGDWVEVVLFWRARAVERENMLGSVHAVGRSGANLGGYDGPPVGAGFPTNLWRPGQLLRMTYRLRLDPAAAAPAALGLAVGLRHPGDVGPAIPRDPDGATLPPAPIVARTALRGHTQDDGRPATAAFEGGVELVGWTAPDNARAGATLYGTLEWRAASHPARDATVFVQLLGPSGVVAQWDAQPLEGAYPTSLWAPGEIVLDSFRLALKPNTAPGEYRLIAGLYVLPEVRRLLLPGGADHVELARIAVEP